MTVTDTATVTVEDRVAALEAEVAHLRRALETRTVIGQAQGVLIAREGITAEAAFDVMRRASQRENRKLFEIAERIVTRAVGNPR